VNDGRKGDESGQSFRVAGDGVDTGAAGRVSTAAPASEAPAPADGGVRGDTASPQPVPSSNATIHRQTSERIQGLLFAYARA
jgi:hypothetical protein